MSLVKLRNVGDKPYTLRHAQHEPDGFTLQPGGKDRICHLGVALLYLGNPAAVNKGPAQTDRHRDAELKRIQRKWGYYRGLMSDEAWLGVGVDKVTGQEVGPFVPTIECFDLDDQRMWMVHDDPTGKRRSTLTDARIEDSLSGRAVEAEISELKDQVRRLTDILAAQTAAAAGDEPVDPASVEAQLASAMEPDQSQAERNEQRDDIPPPPKSGKVTKDKPRTPKAGARS